MKLRSVKLRNEVVVAAGEVFARSSMKLRSVKLRNYVLFGHLAVHEASSMKLRSVKLRNANSFAESFPYSLLNEVAKRKASQLREASDG